MAEIEQNAVSVIEMYRAQDVHLHWGGHWNGYDMRRSGPERLAERRAEMTGEWGVAQVLRAARFIDQAPRIKGVNKRRSTYGWKHVAEGFFKNQNPGEDYYVGEGSFLIAAWAMGLLVKMDTDGTHWVNLAEAAAAAVRTEAKRLQRAA
jgi:hypothetical protein